ncbi:MAG: nucleoside recognition domain-containing protein [Thermoactinomyces sp.]
MQKIDWKYGLKSGWKTAVELSKVVFPIAFLVHIAKHTAILAWLAGLVAPLMSWFGLGGEAAIPLVLGNVLNLYAALGAIAALDLTVKQAFILAIMLSFSHNMFIETALCRKVGVPVWVPVLVRGGLAVFSGLMVNLLWQGGSNPASINLIASEPAAYSGWGDMLLSAVWTAASGILQFVVIIIPLTLFLQALKDLHVLDRIAVWISPLLKPFGIVKEGSITMASGLLAGLFLGAGLIIQQAKEYNLSKRDITLIIVFLASCHAVIEDTVVFIPLGIPVYYVLLMRFAAAVLLTFTVAQIWRRPAPRYATSHNG